jgi:mono/diheme cytochrome c family protein
MKAATAVLAGAVLAASGLADAQEVSKETIRAIREGRAHYMQQCAACHGLLAKGNTSVALGTDGRTCAPPDLTSISEREGRFDGVRVLSQIRLGDGRAGMPALRGTHGRSWSDPRTQLELYNLVKYLEWVQVHGSAGVH